ncbi:hypothetical protein AEMCBJ_01980 [Cupriavidus necator]
MVDERGGLAASGHLLVGCWILISCAATLALQGGKDGADGVAVLVLASVWCLLLPDVLADRIPAMQRIQSFKYELMPTGEQQRQMRRFAGSCRFVFNKALALQKENHDAGGKFIGYVAMAKHLTAWRNSLGRLG